MKRGTEKILSTPSVRVNFAQMSAIAEGLIFGSNFWQIPRSFEMNDSEPEHHHGLWSPDYATHRGLSVVRSARTYE